MLENIQQTAQVAVHHAQLDNIKMPLAKRDANRAPTVHPPTSLDQPAAVHVQRENIKTNKDKVPAMTVPRGHTP